MFLALIGISAGMVVAGGVFSFIVELGVISDFADRTHTAKHILFYEDMVSAGAVLGNLFQILRSICRDVPYSLGYLDCLEEFLLDAGLWHLQKS